MVPAWRSDSSPPDVGGPGWTAALEREWPLAVNGAYSAAGGQSSWLVRPDGFACSIKQGGHFALLWRSWPHQLTLCETSADINARVPIQVILR